MARMVVDSKTGIVKRKPTTGKGALARGGESVYGEGLVAELTAKHVSRGRVGSKWDWYDPTRRRKRGGR